MQHKITFNIKETNEWVSDYICVRKILRNSKFKYIVYIISNPTCENTHVYFFKSMEPCFVFNSF